MQENELAWILVNPCLSKGLTCIQALHLLEVKKKWGNVEYEDMIMI